MPTKVLIDCDPGLDDAIAILLAHGSPEIEIAAITTVAGNQTLDKVTLNARRIATIGGITDVPIAAGCDRPLLRGQITAGNIHGESGLDGPAYFEPTVELSDMHAVDLIIETVLASPGEITLVPIGPLTNVAVAMRREPHIVDAVAGVVLMGGSYTRGNTTAAAEFNILVDPEAAAAVFGARWPVTMVGLDLTTQARATSEVVARIAALGSPVSRFVLDLLGHYDSAVRKVDGAPPLAIHDACAVARVIDPTLMTERPAYVAVELRGEHTYGMTVTDFKCRDRQANTSVPTTLDSERFWSLTIDALERVGRQTVVG
jgi:purine nucleosidase